AGGDRARTRAGTQIRWLQELEGGRLGIEVSRLELEESISLNGERRGGLSGRRGRSLLLSMHQRHARLRPRLPAHREGIRDLPSRAWRQFLKPRDLHQGYLELGYNPVLRRLQGLYRQRASQHPACLVVMVELNR